jgi:hypothetical protein
MRRCEKRLLKIRYEKDIEELGREDKKGDDNTRPET